MTQMETNSQSTFDPTALALEALAWTLGDQARADRLLALTGLTAPQLRDGAGDPAILAAILRFLEGHEPDLIACAEALGREPALLVQGRRALEAA